MPEIRTTGIVLKRQNYGEADRILQIFTSDLGLISAIAKGVRKMKSRQAGALELFRVADLRLHRRTGELFLITNAVINKAFNFSDFKLSALAVIYLMSEWLLVLLPPEKPLPEVYGLTLQIFQALQKTKKFPLIQLAFQAKLLNLLGYLPEFSGPDRAHKLLRFLVSADFTEIPKLVEDKVAFAETEKLLAKIYAELHDRPGKVQGVVRDWS